MEELRTRIIENKVLRRIFGLKKEKGAKGWRIVHNEELHDLYTPQNISRVMSSMRMR
jgi:hypothetical protein